MRSRMILVAAMLAWVPFSGVAAPAPATIDVGGIALVYCSEGTRERFLFNLYRVALYLPRQSTDVRYILRPDTAKAFRVEVLYEGPGPDRVPKDWRRELVPALNAEQMARLKQVFETIAAGDVILASFAPGPGPGPGSALSLNGRPVISDPGHALIDAMVELWLGPNPVSKDVKQALLGTPAG